MKRTLVVVLSLLSLLAFIVGFLAAPDTTMAAEPKGGQKNVRLAKILGKPISTLVNINNLAMWIRADGWSARHPGTGNSGVYFPRGTSTAIFQDGLMYGGLVNDGATPVLRSGGQTYNIGTIEGAIISKGVAESPNDPTVRIFRIRRDYKTADFRQDAAELNDIALSAVTDADAAAVRAQYEKDWNEWPAKKGAPFYDKNNNGTYEAGSDEPGVAGADQVVWFVCNDLDPGATQNLYGSPPIGLEIQVTLWGYARSDALGNVIFKQFKFIYKGTATTPPSGRIDSMYVAQWSDPDLGEYSDDYAGCDVALNLGFVYNSVKSDPEYAKFNLPAPASGYDFFAGPVVKGAATDEAIVDLKKRSGFRNLPMTSFVYFGAGSGISDPPFNYTGTQQWYNLLRGFLPSSPVDKPLPFLNPQGLPVKYVLSGDPVTGTGWVDGQTAAAGDRRIVLTSGSFTMAVGDTQAVVVALLGGIGGDNKSSVAVIKFNDRFAQDAFNNLFQLPKPPAAPALSFTQLDGEILLNWAADPAAVAKTEGQNELGYTFEGYNVYQLPSASASRSQVKKLATFDLVNNITTILADNFDIESGQILRLPAQIGLDNGIKRFVKISRDVFRDRPLINGSNYYFAVTAYNANPDPLAAIPSLESPFQVVTVVPQTSKPGVRASTLTTLKVTHKGVSDGTSEAIVVDAAKMTGDAYKVTFKSLPSGESIWSLTNTTKNKVILVDQPNQTGDDDYLVIDGVQVKVVGPPPGMKEFGLNGTTRRISFAGAEALGLEGFNGSIGLAFGHWFSSSTVTPAGLKNVVLKHAATDVNGNLIDPNDPDASFAYRYLRRAAVAPSKPEFAPFIVNPTAGYAYQDYKKTFPWAAYDIEANPPRRLMVGFHENNIPTGLVDGKWWPPETASAIPNAFEATSPREFFFVFDVPYSETPDPALQKDALNNTLPMMWWGGPTRRGANVSFVGNEEFVIFANHVNSETDEFTFTSEAPSKSDELAKTDVEKVNVYPNPYLGFNRAELNRFNRFVTFTHLPGQATIRIFSLAGVLLRTIQKDGDSQFSTWDLQNEDGLPAASGIYIAHIDMPALGKTKILKFSVIQEQQFLERY